MILYSLNNDFLPLKFNKVGRIYVAVDSSKVLYPTKKIKSDIPFELSYTFYEIDGKIYDSCFTNEGGVGWFINKYNKKIIRTKIYKKYKKIIKYRQLNIFDL